MELRIGSMFCGAGGFDVGFHGGFESLGVEYERLPYKTVWANDLEIAAHMTWKANPRYLDANGFVLGDIRKIDVSSIPDFDVLLGGFPCQPFSMAQALSNSRPGINEERGTLFEEVERIVVAKKPMAIVLENVQGILTSYMPDGTPVPEEIAKRLRVLGYRVSMSLLRAEEYGVPQRRKRLIIVGINEGLGAQPFMFSKMVPNVKPEALGHRTLRFVVDGIKPDMPNANDIKGFSNVEMLAHIKKSWMDAPDELLPERLAKARKVGKRINAYRRYGLDEIATTITADFKPEITAVIHPIEHRFYSVREAARIQSFPDDFVFTGSLAQKYMLVGNAVPPVLAWVLAKTLAKRLRALE
jgi:DNA (cytosine-5)-methyltransferase 1